MRSVLENGGVQNDIWFQSFGVDIAISCHNVQTRQSRRGADSREKWWSWGRQYRKISPSTSSGIQWMGDIASRQMLIWCRYIMRVWRRFDKRCFRTGSRSRWVSEIAAVRNSICCLQKSMCMRRHRRCCCRGLETYLLGEMNFATS